MKNSLFALLCLALLAPSCRNESPFAKKDNVYSVTLAGVRLGDGVPIEMDAYIRWKVETPGVFYNQFPTADSFNRLVLYPRAMELSGSIANRFPSVDSVFASDRELFLDEVKKTLLTGLAEKGILIKDVAVSRLGFPKSYTDAMEAVGMKARHLEGIRHQNEVDLEQADASRKKADADAGVSIAQAEANARLARIEAKTEEARRSSELARAETAAQRLRKQATAQADSVRSFNQAEYERLAELKNLDVEKRRNLDDLDVDKQRKEKRADLDSQLDLAALITQHPDFAAFLINRELASKVDIAVLPTSADASILGGFLQKPRKEVEKEGN